MTISPKTSTGEAGVAGSRNLTATIEPSNATNKNITFKTEDVDGLTVSSSGKLEWTENTPSGTYETIVTTEDGNFADVHTLTLEQIEDPDPVNEEDTEPASIEISPKEHTFIDIWEPYTAKRFDVTILPEDADQTFTVESSDPSIFRARKEGMQAVAESIKAGTATLTVKTVNGLTATATINVPEQG